VKILVPVKQVTALDEDFALAEDGKGVASGCVGYELNEWDEYSYEAALRIMENHDGVEIVPVTVGPEAADAVLRKCLAKGGERGIRVWSEALEGAAPNVVARALAATAKRENADLIFAGTLASDHSYAQTGICIAAELGWAHAAVVSKIDCTPGGPIELRRELEGGMEEELTLEPPAVVTIQVGINEPRYALLRGARQAEGKPIELLSPAELGLTAADIGEAGSFFRLRRLLVPEPRRAEFLQGTPAEQARRLAGIIKEARQARGGQAGGASS